MGAHVFYYDTDYLKRFTYLKGTKILSEIDDIIKK